MLNFISFLDFKQKKSYQCSLMMMVSKLHMVAKSICNYYSKYVI